MSSGRNANGNGACRLAVVKCMARVRETPSSVGGRSMLCVHEKKKWQTKTKNGCEAVRKEEERWTDKSEKNAARGFILFLALFAVIKHSSPLLHPATSRAGETCREWMNLAMKHNDAC